VGELFEFGDVDVFTAGAVGSPGQRVFFLQARIGTDRVSVKCEKQQVAALSQYLRRLLVDLPAIENRPLPASLDLAVPSEQLFVLGAIGLGFDQERDRFVVMLEEVVPLDEDGDPEPDALEDQSKLRVFISRGQAEAFCDRADEVVAAGRPTCLWCGNPIDPDGHPCPRMN
jgi:uncharacterized repeat protein (TIGR03847 family)